MQYEVEIKSLLGSPENANKLRIRLKEVDSNTTLQTASKQLNHYFIGGDLHALARAMSPHLSSEAFETLISLADRSKEFSVRTRQKDEQVLFVAKASVDDTTSSNGIMRIEFEEPVSLSLDALDEIILGSGFSYQAKWSREREEYACKDAVVCLDRNAGYGWLAEFEKVIHDDTELAGARKDIEALMKACGVEELPQNRLERMFAFYNAHWPEYYGTDKIFTIE